MYKRQPKEEQNFTTLLAMIDASEVREEDENFKNAVDLSLIHIFYKNYLLMYRIKNISAF